MIALLLALTISVQTPGRLQPGTGVVTGTLKIEGGGSAEGIRVGAVATDDPTVSSFLSVAETDAAGNFRLTNVPAGRYYIVAGRLDKLQFFPQGNTPGQAREIVVEAAKINTNVNFSVPGGSSRPPQPRSSGLNSMTPQEFGAYTAISRESNRDRRLQLLEAFETSFPRSPALSGVLMSLMNEYGSRGNEAKATEYGEKIVKSDPRGASGLILVSRNYTIMQINPAKAIEYAEKAVAFTASTKGSLNDNAQANLTWVKKTAAWQQQQFLKFVRPRAQQTKK